MIHCRNHKSPPLVPVLNQINQYIPRHPVSLNFLLVLVFLVASLLLAFAAISHMHSYSPPFVLCAIPISSTLISSFSLYLKSTSYEAHHYAVFTNHLSLHLSLVQIFFSALCSQTHSVFVPPLTL
jgi:hypothetical protein